jgi:hypothetical protein
MGQSTVTPIGRRAGELSKISRKQRQFRQAHRVGPALRDVERLQGLGGGAARQVVDRAVKPQNPELMFKASHRDEMVLLEQKFSIVRKTVVVRAPARPQPL